MDVVAFDQSNHEEASNFLVRAHKDRASLELEQARFCGSSEWQSGRRAELIDHIKICVNTILELSGDAVESMRQPNTARSRRTRSSGDERDSHHNAECANSSLGVRIAGLARASSGFERQTCCYSWWSKLCIYDEG